MKTVENIIILLTICILTAAFSWLSVFILIGVFIDIAPYTLNNSFYISEISLTFSVYFLAALFAIKITNLYPLIAALPVGITGIFIYYVELGGFECVGVCGMPLWYDLASFFKHIGATLGAAMFFLFKYSSDNATGISPFKKPNWLSKLPSIKSIFVVLSSFMAGFIILATAAFTNISANAKRVSIYSKILNETRNLTIFLPSDYVGSDKTYDVLYTLDGQNPQHNYMAAATAKILVRLGLIPEIIIVAIDGQGTRQRDFRVKGAVAVDGRKTSGNAILFQSFLENELIPNIAKNYRTGERKLLAGHSYGGLFTAYSFTQHKGIFDGYFCFSPSFQDQDSSAASFKKGLNDILTQKTFIYLNLGLEGSEMRKLFKQVETYLDKHPVEKLHSKVNYYSLPHALIMVPGYFEALYQFYETQES